MPRTGDFIATLHVLAAGNAPVEQLQHAVRAVFTRFVQDAEAPLGNQSAVEASVVELQDALTAASASSASCAKAYALAQRAVELDETDSFAISILGEIYWFRREYDQARSEIKKSLDLNPDDPVVRRYYGMFLAATGGRGDRTNRPVEAAKSLRYPRGAMD